MDAVPSTTNISHTSVPTCLIRMAGTDGSLFAEGVLPVGKHILAYILRIYCISAKPYFTNNLFFIVSKSTADMSLSGGDHDAKNLTHAACKTGFDDDIDTSIYWYVKIIDIPRDIEKITYERLSTCDLIHLMTVTNYDKESICISFAKDISDGSHVPEHTKQDLVLLPNKSTMFACIEDKNTYILIEGDSDDYLTM